MGCHQSKIQEQVQEPATATAPVPVPVPAAPATGDLVIHSATETAVATSPKASTEEPTEEAVAPAPVAEEPKEEPATTSTDEVAAAPVQPEEETPAPESTEAEASETPAEASAVAEPAVQEEEEAAAAVEQPEEEQTTAEAVVEEVVEEVVAAAVTEPETESTPAEEETKSPTSEIEFAPAGITFGERNVAFYAFKVVDKANPAAGDKTISKRFNDFKALHAAVAKYMASEENVPSGQQDKFQSYPALPALPRAGLGSFVKGRRDKNLTEDREAQFAKILNAIARHPVAYQSREVQAFLA